MDIIIIRIRFELQQAYLFDLASSASASSLDVALTEHVERVDLTAMLLLTCTGWSRDIDPYSFTPEQCVSVDIFHILQTHNLLCINQISKKNGYQGYHILILSFWDKIRKGL